MQVPIPVAQHTGGLSHTTLGILLAVGALVCFGVFALYGAKIDGDRQRVRDHGGHPVTGADGTVHAREQDQP